MRCIKCNNDSDFINENGMCAGCADKHKSETSNLRIIEEKAQVPKMNEETLYLNRKFSTFAVVSLAFGLISLIAYWAFPFLPTCAIICGLIGLKKVKTKEKRGKGMAVAGIVLGIIYNIQIIIKLALVGGL